jgi:hypothetical protein
VTAAVGVCLLLLWVLGYTIPRPIPAAFSVAAILSAWSFRTLLLALRPAPQVLATIKMEQIANALPQIKEVWGMALKQQLDDYIDKALDHHQLNNGLDEEYYISALLYRAGPKSVIGHVLTTVSRRHEMNGITPLEYFISKAEAARVQWERTYGAKAESAGARQMRAMIDKLDVRFDPTPAQEQALAYFRGILANKDREVHANVILAEEAIASIQAEIDQPAKDYYAANTVEKMVYLKKHPRYAADAADIEATCKLYRELASDEKRKYTPFKALQFQRAEDMTVLRELRDFIMSEVGAVNDYHVDTWRTRRMGKEENPMRAYAQLKEDALTLATTQKTFRPDVEVWKLIVTRDLPGGPFFTYPLHNVVYNIMQTRKDDYDHPIPTTTGK